MISTRTVGITCILLAVFTPFLIAYNLGEQDVIPYALGFYISLFIGILVYRYSFDLLQIYGISTLVFLITIMVIDRSISGVLFSYGMIIAYLVLSGSHILINYRRVADIEAEK